MAATIWVTQALLDIFESGHDSAPLADVLDAAGGTIDELAWCVAFDRPWCFDVSVSSDFQTRAAKTLETRYGLTLGKPAFHDVGDLIDRLAQKRPRSASCWYHHGVYRHVGGLQHRRRGGAA